MKQYSYDKNAGKHVSPEGEFLPRGHVARNLEIGDEWQDEKEKWHKITSKEVIEGFTFVRSLSIEGGE